MRLPEDEESTFDLFTDWLYSRRCEMLPEEEDQDEEEENDNDDDDYNDKYQLSDERFEQVFRLFTFAEKYEILELKKLIIKTLFAQIRLCRYGPPNPSIAYAYDFTTQGSGLRQMLVDWHVWELRPSWFKKRRTQAFLRQQPDFALDVCLAFANRIENGSYDNPFTGEVPERYLDQKAEQQECAPNSDVPQESTSKFTAYNGCMRQS